MGPSEFLAYAREFADHEGACLLYSGRYANRSFLFLHPYETICLEAPSWEELKAKLHFSGDSYPEWVGYLSYEMGERSDLQKTIALPKPNIPYAYFQRMGEVIIYDHTTEQIQRVVRNSRASAKSIQNPKPFQVLKPLETEKVYSQKIAKIKEHICKGDIYQANLSQQLLLSGYQQPFSLFEKIHALNPAPFSAYLNLSPCAIISSSPERFLMRKGQELQTRPIKGTAPRAVCEVEDQQNRQHLLTSEKEKAELLMITDLMRNDLAKVSLSGTTKTKALWNCEAYANVHHLLSQIESKCAQNAHSVDLIRGCFPGGSITGCPKLRAMEILAEVEQRARGIYTGSIGYFCGNGDFDFNIAIRTMVLKENVLDIQLGGAITYDSDPKREYEETLYKGASLFQSIEELCAFLGT